MLKVIYWTRFAFRTRYIKFSFYFLSIFPEETIYTGYKSPNSWNFYFSDQKRVQYKKLPKYSTKYAYDYTKAKDL
jgi:hypothetical protein